MAPSSSWSTPQLGATVVPLDRVQKLEAQMATLLNHIQPWMQKSIAESEARMERRMEGMMDRKVQAVNKCLDAFELRVLERSTPAIDLSALQADVASLRIDVEAIFVAPSVEPQVAPTALADDTVLDALFRLYCDYCHLRNHTRANCYRLIGYPPNFKFTRKKGVDDKGGRGQSYGNRRPQANNVNHASNQDENGPPPDPVQIVPFL
ncbi:hypothetical protein H5410_036047 [Solanum commersonii]|uniref:Integrase core domain containing protein n=1 Tax=Solanum commersonii TaxID=4109 RepID=A0A9J5Y4J3_SOLCO|nr:hypothetical protein H5410_036047 [Solanum commersonii]